MTEPRREGFSVARLQAPADLGRIDRLVTAGDVSRYWRALPGDVRPPGALPVMLFDQDPVCLIARRWSHGRTVQTRARWSVIRRVGAGEYLTAAARIARTYEKNGLGRVSIETTGRAGGAPVGYVDLEEVTDPPARRSPVRGREPAAGQAWTYRWQPTAEQLVAYSGRMLPARNIHTDRDLARAAGHPDLLIQGHHTLALVIELLTGRLGRPAPVSALARFTRSWYVNQVAIIRAWPAWSGSGGLACAWHVTVVAGGEVAVVADLRVGGAV